MVLRLRSAPLDRCRPQHGAGSDSRNREWVSVFADYDRVGSKHEVEQFAFGQLAVIEHVPSGAGSATGLGAFQFDALEIKAAMVRQGIRERRPSNIVFPIHVPMIALPANEPQLPSLCRPVWRIRSGSRRVGVRQENAGGRRHATVRILASYDGLQIHRVGLRATFKPTMGIVNPAYIH